MKINLILLLLFFAGWSQAEAEWRLVKDKNGIQIHAALLPGHDLKHHRATTVINKDMDTILNALQDASACPQWVYQCISNRMVEMIDVKQRVYHTTINSPLWFKNRDFYLRSDVVYDREQPAFTIQLQSQPDHAPELAGHIRVIDLSMRWHLIKLDDERTAVTYEVYIDPVFPIKSVNHQMIKRSTFKTIEGLHQLVQNPKYGVTKYSASELDMLTEPSL